MKNRFTIYHLPFTILRHPLFSGSFIMFAGSMAINVINYIYHLLMGRILGPADYGVLASLYSVIYIIGIIPLSASMAIVKFISSAPDNPSRAVIYHAINKFVLYLALAMGILIILLSPLIAGFLKISNFWNVAIIGPILFFSLITLVNQSTLQGVLDFMGYIIPNFVSCLIKLLIGLIFIFLGWSVLGAMAGILIGVFLAYLISLKSITRVIKNYKQGSYNLSPFLKYSLPVLIQAFAFSSIFTIDVILVKHFFPPFEAGLYAALSTLGKIIFFAVSPITGAMFPIIAGRHSRGEKHGRILLTAAGGTIIISLGIILLYFFFPDYAISLLYGKAYLLAKGNLIWIGLFMGFYSLAYLLTNYFLSIGKTKIIFFPLIMALIQIAAIWAGHGSLLQVIQISLSIMVILCLALLLYLGYNLSLCRGKNAVKNFFL